LSIKDQIFLAETVDDAFQQVIAPWLKDAHTQALEKKTHALVVPHTSTAFFLKQAWAKLGQGCWGVHFLTPGALRKKLGDHTGKRPLIALREDLRLLLCTTITKLPHNKTAQSLKYQPESFLKLYDELCGAGWHAKDFPSTALQELAEAFTHTLEEKGLWTIQQYDLFLKDQIANYSHCFDSLLLYGFSGKNTKHLHLLQAAANVSKSTSLCSFYTPPTLAEEAWLGTWEERLTPAIPLPTQEESPRPFQAWQYALEQDTPTPSNHAPSLHIHESPDQEAKALVTQALHTLQDPTCTRLGIIFPSQTCPLAWAIARQLQLKNIPHYDHLGHRCAPSTEQLCLEAWAQLQKEANVDALLHFAECLHHHGKLDYCTLETFKKKYQQAFFEIMTDELSVLNTYLRQQNTSSAILRFWEKYPLLPTTDTPEQLFQKAYKSLELILESETLKMLVAQGDFLKQETEETLELSPFLAWLTEIITPAHRSQSPSGKHPFARLHLITANEAALQSWSHLTLAGLQEKAWSPPTQELPFLDEETLLSYNQKALCTGSQGEGHLVFKRKHTLLTSSSMLNAQKKACLATLIGMPQQALSLSASLKQNHQNNPISHWLILLYALQQNRLLTPNLLEAAQKSTQKEPTTTSIHDTISSTRIAYEARRNPSEPFGPYEFSFQTPPQEGILLPCKSWEDALNNPSRAWFKNILKTRKELCAKEESIHALTLGTWAHRWLLWDEANSCFAPSPKIKDWEASTLKKAQSTFTQAQNTYQQLGRELPQYWIATWRKALRTSLKLLKQLTEITADWPFMSMEHALNTPARPPLNIPLYGRVDLIFAKQPNTDGPCWLFDFKTGQQDPLTVKKIQEGKNLQLALYALAIPHEKSEEIEISLLQPNKALKKGMSQEKLLSLENLICGLEAIHKIGVLGIRGPLKPTFGLKTQLPLATLDIPSNTLESKWALSHPALATSP